MRQIAFDLASPPRFGADDLLVASANAEAVAAIERWPDWPGNMLLLLGPEGAGKSHLGHIWASRASASRLTGEDLADLGPERLGHTPVFIDDADRLAPETEATLFHLLNLARETGRSTLVTARTAPDAWGLRTADLLSRLRLAPVVRVREPDEELVQAVLVKLIADRQLSVDTTVLAFLARRMERSIGAARRLVAALDQFSLAAGRPITRSVAAEVLHALDALETSGHGGVTGVGENPRDP